MDVLNFSNIHHHFTSFLDESYCTSIFLLLSQNIINTYLAYKSSEVQLSASDSQIKQRVKIKKKGTGWRLVDQLEASTAMQGEGAIENLMQREDTRQLKGLRRVGFWALLRKLHSPDRESSLRVQGRPIPTVDDSSSVSSGPDPRGWSVLSWGACRAG